MSKPIRKYRWLRRTIRITVVLVILFIISCFVFDHYVQFRKSDDELKKIFTQNKIEAKINYYTTHGRTLRYLEAGNDSLPTLLMLHGSPGSISYYGGRLADPSIRNNFKVYAV